MWLENLFFSRFGDWSRKQGHEVSREEGANLALPLLLECVETGEVSCLDSQTSPISKDMLEKHGVRQFEMNTNWVGSPQDWICPCCRRPKFEISRIGNRGQILAKNVIHHDHMGDVLHEAFHTAFAEAGTELEQVDGLRLIERMSEAFAAYEPILVCEDCNNADTAAKAMLQIPREFSFSVRQISRFIDVAPHRSHSISEGNARQEWESAKEAFVLRMRIIKAVAKVAATDCHWYEPHDRRFEPVPVYSHGGRQSELISRWLSWETLSDALGMQTRITPRDMSRWRTVRPKPGKPLPPNFVAMLRSTDYMAEKWDETPSDWCCPICSRGKAEIVYVSDKGKVHFSIVDAPRNWRLEGRICHHCNKLQQRLKWEVKEVVGDFEDSRQIASPAAVSAILLARAHSDHAVRTAEAKALVAKMVEAYG